MNPSNPDHPDLTAYALGELPHEQEHEMREWIATHPEAQTELARIESISEALHHSAPIPVLKLTPQQRQNVLTAPKGPRILTPMMPRQPMAKPRHRFSPFLASVTRIAAALAVAGIAFSLGRHSGTSPRDDAASAGSESPTPALAPSSPSLPADATPAAPTDSRPAVADISRNIGPKPEAASSSVTEPSSSASSGVAAEVNAAAVASRTPSVIAAPAAASSSVTTSLSTGIADTPSVAPGPVATVAAKTETRKPAPAAMPAIDTRGYVAVNREPVSKVTIRPTDTRPAPVKTKGEALASPISPISAPEKAPARAPELAIQSWKVEVASCPWNPSHKLMRVLVQAPAVQAAANSTANTYPLHVKFEDLTVRSYRLLSESHVPPHPGASNAAHVMWYEVIPNGASNEANREGGRPMATVSVSNARFDSPAVGPFDSKENPTLRAIDRGVKWENAREDFLFETAIVGFGLLLRGEENLGSLNHELVLKLAQHAKGEKELDGERAKFIRLVQEARRMTGI